MTEADVPSPVDFRTMRDASHWAGEVSNLRPWRSAFFAAFTRELKLLEGRGASVLELGSGPGFLAQHLLANLKLDKYTALDFSDPMHSLARERLGQKAGAVEFLMRDFLQPDWNKGLPRYSGLVTLQAVHELRHKRKAPALYAQARPHVQPYGVFLMCDHYCGAGGQTNPSLYMSESEHVAALTQAGFGEVTCIHKEGGMVLYRARPT